MKKRQILGLEQLEARDTPDVSLGHSALPLPPKPIFFGEGPSVVPRSPDDSSADAFSWHALETLFSNSDEMEKLLADSARLLPSAEQPAQSPVASASADAAPQGWHLLCNYTRKAIRNEEQRYGRLADHEDLVHQVYVEWREQVGPAEQAYAGLLDKESAERQILRKTVRRVIDHVRYEQNRQKRTVELFDQEAPANPVEQDWRDVQLDWRLGDVPNAQERQVLELRRQGMTFEEIGSEMGLVKQRVCETFNSVLQQLQELYAS